jgi:hypothetical protein
MIHVVVLIFSLCFRPWPFVALTGFFTHHIGFGCFVSLFPYELLRVLTRAEIRSRICDAPCSVWTFYWCNCNCAGFAIGRGHVRGARFLRVFGVGGAVN